MRLAEASETQQYQTGATESTASKGGNQSLIIGCRGSAGRNPLDSDAASGLECGPEGVPALSRPTIERTAVRSHFVIQGSGPAEEGLIRGVAVRPLRPIPDDRGHFAEIFRDADPIAEGFGFRHNHENQDDIFCPLVGSARIVLVDIRTESETRGVANSVFAGELYPKAVRIPAGVAHGYEVLPGPDLILVYFTNRIYDPSDEHRFPHDDPAIGFAHWGVRNR
jgi:dTDP-4-dehydrorhamnose 3,5-epimerase